MSLRMVTAPVLAQRETARQRVRQDHRQPPTSRPEPCSSRLPWSQITDPSVPVSHLTTIQRAHCQRCHEPRPFSSRSTAIPQSASAALVSHPDTLRTLRFRAWATPVRRASSGRFWHGFAVRLAACMDAGRRCNSRLCWTTDAEEMHSDSNNDFERLLSPEEVARACGLSRRAVYRAIARGELRAARLCHRLRFSLRSWSAGSASKRLLRRLQRRGG